MAPVRLRVQAHDQVPRLASLAVLAIDENRPPTRRDESTSFSTFNIRRAARRGGGSDPSAQAYVRRVRRGYDTRTCTRCRARARRARSYRRARRPGARSRAKRRARALAGTRRAAASSVRARPGRRARRRRGATGPARGAREARADASAAARAPSAPSLARREEGAEGRAIAPRQKPEGNFSNREKQRRSARRGVRPTRRRAAST